MSEQSSHIQFQNTNVWDTKQLVTMALMCAIGALLAFVQIPLIPGVTFLTYDPSFVPALVVGFAFGPGAGVATGSVAVVIYGLIIGDWVGALMNVIMCICFVLPASLVYRRVHTMRGALCGIALSVVAVLCGCIVANLTVGVWFWYGSMDVILPLMIPAVLPFNLAKAVLNAALTLLVYKAISNMITPKKNQVKGR